MTANFRETSCYDDGEPRIQVLDYPVTGLGSEMYVEWRDDAFHRPGEWVNTDVPFPLDPGKARAIAAALLAWAEEQEGKPSA